MRVALLFAVLLPLLAPAAAAQPADTLRLGLEAAVARALAVSPEVAIEAADVDHARARYRFARANRFLTEFEATTAHAPAPTLDNPNDTPTDRLYLDPDVRNDWEHLTMFNQVEVKLVQPIWTWGEIGQSIRAARLGIEVEEAATRAKAHEVALRTAELYYDAQLAAALARIADEAERALERATEELDRMMADGSPDVDDADLFGVQITGFEIRRRAVEVAQGQATARVALRRQLLLPDDAVVVAGDETLAPLPYAVDALESYFAHALVHRPELAQAEAGLAAREALVEARRSDYYPKLFVAGQAKYAYTPDRYRQRNPYISEGLRANSVRAGVGMRQKLNFFQTRARVEQARAEANEVRHQSEAAEQLVLFEVEQAWRRVQTARAALEAREGALLVSREWLRTEQINFDLDLGDTDNLIDAVQANLELQAAYQQAVRDYNVAVLRLLDASGILLPTLEAGTLVEQ